MIYLAIKAYSNKLKLEKAEKKKDYKQLFICYPKHIIQIPSPPITLLSDSTKIDYWCLPSSTVTNTFTAWLLPLFTSAILPACLWSVSLHCQIPSPLMSSNNWRFASRLHLCPISIILMLSLNWPASLVDCVNHQLLLSKFPQIATEALINVWCR